MIGLEIVMNLDTLHTEPSLHRAPEKAFMSVQDLGTSSIFRRPFFIQGGKCLTNLAKVTDNQAFPGK